MRTPGSKALRRGRCTIPRQIYLVTFTTRQRHNYFLDRELANIAAAALSSEQAWADSRLLCWVLMPDHWHGLVELGYLESLSRNVGRAKALASRALQTGAPLWEKSFHDHALRAEEGLLDVARYIIGNPIRAGLADRSIDYPYWDCIWLKCPETWKDLMGDQTVGAAMAAT